MKYYIMTITYNFDSSYIAKYFDTRDEAIAAMNNYLKNEIGYVMQNSGYKPSVLNWLEDDVTLVYAEGYSLENLKDGKHRLEDFAEYRVFEVEI